MGRYKIQTSPPWDKIVSVDQLEEIYLEDTMSNRRIDLTDLLEWGDIVFDSVEELFNKG